MQVFGNIANSPERKESRTTGKAYWQFRLCEAQRGVDNDPSWYSVRVMKADDPKFSKGDFVKVTGKLKADFYLSREGKPTGTLLIIAFDATKIAKPSATTAEVAGKADESTSAGVTSAAAAVQTGVSLPMGATDEPTPLSPSAQAVPPSRKPQPVQAKPQIAPMQSLPAFTLPSTFTPSWAMSFGAPVQAK